MFYIREKEDLIRTSNKTLGKNFNSFWQTWEIPKFYGLKPLRNVRGFFTLSLFATGLAILRVSEM